VKYNILFSIFLISLLSACGRAPQEVPQPKIGDTALTQQYAGDNLKDYSKWLASTVVNSIRGSAFEEVAEVDSLKSKLLAQQADSVCGFEPTNDPEEFKDADLDKVMKIFQRTFVNCEQDKGSHIEIKNGQIWIEDSNDDDAESGLRSRAVDLTFDFLDKFNNRAQQLKFQDTWDFTILKDSNRGSLSYALTMIATDYQRASETSVRGQLSLTGVYEAVADKNGGFDKNDYDNAVISNASGELLVNDKDAFGVTLENLQFSETCLATPVSGKLSLSDNTNVFIVEFAGCEAATYSYNGNMVFAPTSESTPAQ
jgi:hypothetical protein